MRATRHVVQVVRGQDSVLGPHPEELEGIFCRFAFKHEEVLDNKLVLLSPSDAQALLLFSYGLGVRALFAAHYGQSTLVEEVEHLLIVDLEKGAKHLVVTAGSALVLPQLSKLTVQFVNAPLRDTYVFACVVSFNCTFACSKFGLSLARCPHKIIALHGECLARACLSIGKNSAVIALKDVNKVGSLLQ